MRCNNTTFYDNLRNSVRNEGNFINSSTALEIDTFYVKYCPELAQYYKINLNFATSFYINIKTVLLYLVFLWDFMRPKLCA